MEYTNKYNLITYEVWENLDKKLRKDYKAGRGKTDISVTQLKDSPLVAVLAREYGDVIQKDITDTIMTADGSVIHKALEEAAPAHWLVEHRFFKEVDGLVISGQADIVIPTKVSDDGCIESCILGDYKNTSIYKLKKDVSELDDYSAQLNILAYLMSDPDWVEDQHGEPVTWTAPEKIEKMLIVGKAKDFSRAKAIQNNFPASLKEIEVPQWTEEETLKFITDRLNLHKEARRLAKEEGIDSIPQCTPEEMFADPDKFAVMKEKQKRATKLFDNKEEAQKLAKEKGKEYYVETRPGIRKRCVFGYCDYVKFCPYGQQAEDKKKGKEAFKKLMDKKLKKGDGDGENS